MSGRLENEIGTIVIDDSVLGTIAGLAAMECYGLVGMATRTGASGLVELLKRENMTKGVKIYAENNDLEIDLFIIVEFGTNISTVANNIIEKVKYNIENMTGMKVKKVNIHVQGVRVEK